MKCPYCSHADTKVIETRESENTTRRRRECLKCQKRFTTYEKVEEITLRVVKKDNTREPFEREKLEKGMLRACEKRPVPYERIKKAVDEIESALRKRKSIEVTSKEIGDLVVKKLLAMDKVAYIRYASVFKGFDDPAEFKKAVQEIVKKR